MSQKNSHQGFGLSLGPAPAGMSYTSMGAGVGLAVGSIVPGLGSAIGYLMGSVVGGVMDLFAGASAINRAKRKMWAAFYAAIEKRYNTQIFSGCITELGSSMQYLIELGSKPGTLEFDKLLKQDLSTGFCIYRGNGSIDLFTPDGKPVASIDGSGNIQPYSQNVDLAAGPQWQQAWHDLNAAALQAWADISKSNILFDQELAQEQATENRSFITKVLINTGVMLLMFGYIVRQKGKLEEIREYKVRRAMQMRMAAKPMPAKAVTSSVIPQAVKLQQGKKPK